MNDNDEDAYHSSIDHALVRCTIYNISVMSFTSSQRDTNLDPPCS